MPSDGAAARRPAQEFSCARKPKSSSNPSGSRSCCYGGIFDWDTAHARLETLNKRAEDSSLWSNPQAAQKVMRERQMLERSIAGYNKLERDLE